MSSTTINLENKALLIPETNPAIVTNNYPGEIRNFAFLLLNNFSMMSLTSALDALRTANLLSETKIYSFQMISLDGQPVCGDLGFSAVVDYSIDQIDIQHIDALVICGGLRADLSADKTLTRFLHRQKVRKLALGSLWNGAFALAHAGLLNERECTVHKENQASFREAFSRVKLKNKSFTITTGLFTCAGGNSALDMMLNLIAKHQGKKLIRGICDILIVDRVGEEEQAMFYNEFLGGELPTNLQEVVALMENNMEEMLSTDEMGALVGITRRQIERLFLRYFAISPARFYLELRLKRANQLLTQTQLSISDISLACGFVSYPHFSKCYKQYFNYPPSVNRKT